MSYAAAAFPNNQVGLEVTKGGESAAPPRETRQTIEQALASSVARIALLDPRDMVRAFIPSELEEGNSRVRATHGDSARRALIGPDFIMFPGANPEVFRDRPTLELLGLYVLRRELAPKREYFEMGFLEEDLSSSGRDVAMAKARNRLTEVLDHNGYPLVYTTSGRRWFRSGIEDVLIRDCRHDKFYRKELMERLAGLWRQHILHNGPAPKIYSEDGILAAQMAQTMVDMDLLRDSQIARFSGLNLLITAAQKSLNSGQNSGKDENVPEDPPSSMRELIIQELSPAWQEKAACKTSGPEGGLNSLFYSPRPERPESESEQTEREKSAKAICASCEAKSKCLEYALANREKDGIWGGMTEKERKKLKP